MAGCLDSYFAQIAGATEHKEGTAEDLTGVKVIDDYTVEVTLLQPDALFLSSAASRQRILPKHILESVSPADIDKNEFARKPIYTGPYILEEWRDGESITFRANENYFEGKPNIDTIVARFISDAATANNELSSGGLDIGVVPPDLLAAYEQDSNFTIRELPGLRIVYIQLDTTLPIFNDARVRQAISHAIDKQTVIDANYLGRAKWGAASSPRWPGSSIRTLHSTAMTLKRPPPCWMRRAGPWVMMACAPMPTASGSHSPFRCRRPTVWTDW
jgi:ABC-type transport system substrate-binding protein